jgi:hypothetical protein
MVEAERQQMYRYRKGKANHESGDDIHGFQVRRGRLSVPLPVWDEGRNIGAARRNRNRLVPCPGRCGEHFIQRSGRGFFAQPTLELAIEPKKRKVQMSTGGDGNPERARKDVQRQ